MFLQFLIAAVVIGADQLTKYIVETHMRLWESIPLLGGIFHITYVKNTGMAFSLLFSQSKAVTAITLSVITLVILFSFLWKDKNFLFRLSMGLLIGGSVSNNVISRLFSGSVTDFLQIPYWPIFNVADSCLVAGAIGIGIYFLKRGKSDGKIRVEGDDSRSR